MQWYDLDKFLLGSNPVSFVPAEGKNYERDRMVTDLSIEIARRHQETGVPYLNFIYYYTTHADYEHPDEYSLFEPEIKGKVDFSDNNLKDRDREKLHNRYRNAIRFADSELERLVSAIKDMGAWNNTILIFTGDHGEELFEESTFGHNTNLNSYQTKVPLVMHIPGKAAIEIEKATSHMDVMQTLLGTISGPDLDAVPFQGRNMLTGDAGVVYIAKAHYQRPVAYAILDKGYKVIVNLDGGFLEVESISEEGDHDKMVSRDVSGEILGLIRQMQALKTVAPITDREQQARQGIH
jgi:membrane-anchored protein YejM (alkaline phosphatase superfamily)